MTEMTRNPLFYVILVFAIISMMKIVYKSDNNRQMQRIQRICATLPQPHSNCNK